MTATSEAGDWIEFIKPFRALRMYRCHTARLSVFSSIRVMTVQTAAKLSQISMIAFLFHLSLTAPAKMLIKTYGAYEHTVSSEVVSAEPLSL